MKEFLRKLYAQECGKGASLDLETFSRTGSRLEFEAGYFARRKALTAAALLFLLGEEEYLAGAEENISRILSEQTWVHPAHGGSIDLFSAETGFALAEIASLLPLSRERKKEISREVEERIALPFREETFWWEKTRGNWLPVCMGNVAGALYYTDREQFEAQRERLSAGLCRYIEGFPEDGWCHEGLEYWNFGFGAFVRCAELLFPELLSLPKVKEIARYPSRCFLAGNVTASFSDCPMDGKADRGLVNFLAKTYGLPLLTGEESAIRAENVPWLSLSRALRDGVLCAQTRTRQGGVYGSVAVFHGEGFSLAVKAGNNGEEHNHNDVGSFILSGEQGQLVCDLGQPLYTREYFSERRYENFVATSLSHSVPIVGGKAQGTGKTFGGILLDGGKKVEFAGAYAGCKKLERRFSILENGVEVTDFFDGEEVTERFVLLAPPSREVEIYSREGYVPTVQRRTWRDHGGEERCAYLLDFAIEKGKREAAFLLLPKKEKIARAGGKGYMQ